MRLASGIIFCVAMLGVSTPAFATSGFDCTIDDASLAFSAAAAMGRGMGGPFLNLAAEANVKHAEAPKDFARLDLKSGLVHSWVDGGELRLHFYYERSGDGPFASLELIIKTNAGEDELTYPGTYALSIFTMDPPADKDGGKTVAVTGKVVCGVE